MFIARNTTRHPVSASLFNCLADFLFYETLRRFPNHLTRVASQNGVYESLCCVLTFN
jgi:hypothetical protein